jgi:Ran GTPase-activating protein (RanGAP) involved in mRNA processing and transport
MQMLETLDISKNHIGHQGAQYLADAFLNNKVNLVLLLLSHLHLHFSTQTLTTFDLSCNKIGDDGVQDLAKAFTNNKVNLSRFIFLIPNSIFSFRHSAASIFRKIRSEIKGLNTSQMLSDIRQ